MVDALLAKEEVEAAGHDHRGAFVHVKIATHLNHHGLDSRLSGDFLRDASVQRF